MSHRPVGSRWEEEVKEEEAGGCSGIEGEVIPGKTGPGNGVRGVGVGENEAGVRGDHSRYSKHTCVLGKRRQCVIVEPRVLPEGACLSPEYCFILLCVPVTVMSPES